MANKPAPAIVVGVSSETVRSAKEAIMAVLASKNADTVKIEALVTLRTVCQINNTSISNCTFKS